MTIAMNEIKLHRTRLFERVPAAKQRAVNVCSMIACVAWNSLKTLHLKRLINHISDRIILH